MLDSQKSSDPLVTVWSRDNYKKWPWASMLVVAVAVGVIFIIAGSPQTLYEATGISLALSLGFITLGSVLLIPSVIAMVIILWILIGNTSGCHVPLRLRNLARAANGKTALTEADLGIETGAKEAVEEIAGTSNCAPGETGLTSGSEDDLDFARGELVLNVHSSDEREFSNSYPLSANRFYTTAGQNNGRSIQEVGTQDIQVWTVHDNQGYTNTEAEMRAELESIQHGYSNNNYDLRSEYEYHNDLGSVHTDDNRSGYGVRDNDLASEYRKDDALRSGYRSSAYDLREGYRQGNGDLRSKVNENMDLQVLPGDSHRKPGLNGVDTRGAEERSHLSNSQWRTRQNDSDSSSYTNHALNPPRNPNHMRNSPKGIKKLTQNGFTNGNSSTMTRYNNIQTKAQKKPTLLSLTRSNPSTPSNRTNGSDNWRAGSGDNPKTILIVNHKRREVMDSAI